MTAVLPEYHPHLHTPTHLPPPNPETPPTPSPSTTPSSSLTSLPSPTQTTNPGKLFVGGLSWETTESSLKTYFSKYGHVQDCVIMRDRHTGHPRGFGFVTFTDLFTATIVAGDKHELDGRVVEAKIAVPRNEIVPTKNIQSIGVGGVGVGGSVGVGIGGGNGVHTVVNKVFVGGLPAACGDVDLETYFGRFGKVVDCQVMYDHQTGNSRGFGFVTFDGDDVVDNVVQFKSHEIMAKYIEVKRAEPRQVMDARKVSGMRVDGNGNGLGVVGAAGHAALMQNMAFANGGMSPIGSHFSPGLGTSPNANGFTTPPGFGNVSSVSPWDQPISPPKPGVWSTGYLQKATGHSEQMANILHKVMFGKTARTTLGSCGFRLPPPVRLERRYHPYT